MSNTIKEVTIRDFKLCSNVFFAPINPGNFKHADLYQDFFITHAMETIGICYVGNVAIKNSVKTNSGTAVLFKKDEIFWRELANRISEKGSLPGIQLAWKPQHLNMQKTFICANKQSTIMEYEDFYNSFEKDDCYVEELLNSVDFAVKCGYKCIQIHAAHGYSLSILLNPAIGHCNSVYETKGYSLIDKISKVLKDRDFILDIRLSYKDGFSNSTCTDEYLSAIVDLGFDIISLSNGFYNIDKTMIYPRKNEEPYLYSIIKFLATKYDSVVWNACGNMEKALLCNDNICSNLTFSIGRQLLADPQVIKKIVENKENEIIKCNECNRCHYYSNSQNGLQPCRIEQ